MSGAPIMAEKERDPDLEFIASLDRDDMDSILCYLSGFDPEAFHAGKAWLERERAQRRADAVAAGVDQSR